MGIELKIDGVTVFSQVEAKTAAVAPDEIVYPFYDPDALHTFANKAEHVAWKAAVAARNANLVEWKAQWQANQDTLPPGAVDCRSFDTDDALFEWYFTFELAPFGLVGPMGSIHRLHVWLDSGAEDTNSEFPMIDLSGGKRHFIRGGWDWTPYMGQLRAVLSRKRGYNDGVTI